MEKLLKLKLKYYKLVSDRKNDTIKDDKEIKGYDRHTRITPVQIKGLAKDDMLKYARGAYLIYEDSGLKEDKKEYNKIKTCLGAIDCHSSSNHNSEWVSNGLIIYDYDHLQKDKIEQIIEIVKDDCVFTMISPSGYGIKIAYYLNDLSSSTFKNVYTNFGLELDTQLGMDTSLGIDNKKKEGYDEACNDLRRLCFITGDIICNNNYTEYDVNNYKQEPVEVKSFNYNSITPATTQTNLNSVEQYLNEAYTYCTKNNLRFNWDYQNWTKLLISVIRLCSDNHELGLKYFILFSELCANYGSVEECTNEYSKWVNYGGIGFNSFAKFLRENGIEANNSGLKQSFEIMYTDDKGKTHLNKNTVKKYIKQKFFRINDSRIIYHKVGNFLKVAFDFEVQSEHKYYDMLNNYFTEVLTEIELTGELKETVIDKIKDVFSIPEFKKITLENKDLQSLYKNDTKEFIYLYTEKGLLKISREGVDFREYEIDDLINESWLAKDAEQNIFINYNPNANWKDYKSLPFYNKLCETTEDFDYLKRIIGYMISRERSFGSNDGVIFIDGKSSSEKGGGASGKSIVANNFNYIRPVLELNNPKQTPFLFSGLNGHNIVNIEDAQWGNLSIRELRCFKDLKVSAEKKNINKVQILRKDTPRLIISSNYTPDSVDSADKRRFHIFHPSTHFNIDYAPTDLLGFQIFDYTTDEWAYWLAFMIECCTCYLREGLNPINKWSFVDEKRKNELDNSAKFSKIRSVIINLLNSHNGYVITNDQLFKEVNDSKFNNMTSFAREYIEGIGMEMGFNTKFVKDRKKNSKTLNKMVIKFEPIATHTAIDIFGSA